MRPGRPEEDEDPPPLEEALARCARPRSLVNGNTGRVIVFVVVACIVVGRTRRRRRGLKKCGQPAPTIKKRTMRTLVFLNLSNGFLSKVLFPIFEGRRRALFAIRARASTPADATMSRENASTANQATFTLENEDHTLGNALRHVLNGNPAVELCGYSVPHPMERRVNVRVQTTGANGTTAQAAMRDALLDVISVCDHVHEAYEKAEEAYEKVGNKK